MKKKKMRNRKEGRSTCSNTDIFLVMSFQEIIFSDEFPSLRSTILNVDGYWKFTHSAAYDAHAM